MLNCSATCSVHPAIPDWHQRLCICCLSVVLCPVFPSHMLLQEANLLLFKGKIQFCSVRPVRIQSFALLPALLQELHFPTVPSHKVTMQILLSVTISS